MSESFTCSKNKWSIVNQINYIWKVINSGTTIQQVKEEISSLLIDLNYIVDCQVEFDDSMNIYKIVITVNDWLNETHLRKLLKPYGNCGHRIVFRLSKPYFPF